MKRYLVVFLFIVSFITNTNVMASVLFATNNSMCTMQMTKQQTDLIPIVEANAHCHQTKVIKNYVNTGCDMGETCDNCFTHCGGALLSVVFSHFVARPPLLVSIQPHYYTPTLSFSFLRPPQTA